MENFLEEVMSANSVDGQLFQKIVHLLSFYETLYLQLMWLQI